MGQICGKEPTAILHMWEKSPKNIHFLSENGWYGADRGIFRIFAGKCPIIFILHSSNGWSTRGGVRRQNFGIWGKPRVSPPCLYDLCGVSCYQVQSTGLKNGLVNLFFKKCHPIPEFFNHDLLRPWIGQIFFFPSNFRGKPTNIPLFWEKSPITIPFVCLFPGNALQHNA